MTNGIHTVHTDRQTAAGSQAERDVEDADD